MLNAEASECHLDVFFGARTISAIVHSNLEDTLHVLVDLQPLKDRDCLGPFLSKWARKRRNVDIFENSFEFNTTPVEMWEVVDGDICLLVCLELLEVAADRIEKCRK